MTDQFAPFLDTATPAFAADPHPIFDALRGSGPVVRDAIGWSTIDYATSEAAFHDPALTPGIDHLLGSRGIEHLWGAPGHTLTDSEGETHQRLRRAVSPWFSVRRIAELRARTQALVAEMLAPFGPGDALDLMSDLADVVPARLFCWMVGAPDGDAPALVRLSKALLSVFTATEAMVEPVRAAKAELAAYTNGLLRTAQGSGDSLGVALVEAERSGALAAGDAFHLLEELLSASVDNTANTAALAVHTLATQPGAWTTVHGEPALLADAIEECGRYEPAIRHTIKAALEPTRIGDVDLDAGEFVSIRIAAAHRDPAVFAEPHRFDLRRARTRPQLAFGAGRHYCLGAALGRMEVHEMVAGLTTRYNGAELPDGADMDRCTAGVVRRLPFRGLA